MADEQNETGTEAETETATVTDLADLGEAVGVVEVAAPLYEKKVDAQGRAYATGKRKNAVARVWIKPGPGKILVNGRDVETYFARPVLRMVINQPFTDANPVAVVTTELEVFKPI